MAPHGCGSHVYNPYNALGSGPGLFYYRYKRTESRSQPGISVSVRDTV